MLDQFKFPPNLHHWNLTENIIKIVRREIAVKMLQRLRGVKAGTETIVPERYAFDAISHACDVRNSSSSTSVERKFGILTTPGDCISGGNYVHPDLYQFGARASIHLPPEKGLASVNPNHDKWNLRCISGIWIGSNYYYAGRGLLGARKTSRFILTATGKTYVSADFTLEDETPQSRRFEGGLLEGERALAWTVGIPDKDDIAKILMDARVQGE